MTNNLPSADYLNLPASLRGPLPDEPEAKPNFPKPPACDRCGKRNYSVIEAAQYRYWKCGDCGLLYPNGRANLFCASKHSHVLQQAGVLED